MKIIFPEISAIYSQTPPGLARPSALLGLKMKHSNSQLAALADTAIEVIRTLVTDAATPPSVRLRAAKLILDSTPGPDDDGDDDDDNAKAMPVPPAAGQ